MRSGSCPKCQASMERGFIVDEGYGTRTAAAWVEGPPVKSMWTGLKMRGRRRLPIEVSRCTRCGYLESYAPAV